MGMTNRSRTPGYAGPGVPQTTTQQTPTQPTQQNGNSSTANMGSIFQSLFPMIMGGIGNVGQAALGAVSSGGNFNPGKSAIQPQLNNNAGRMVNAAAGLGNLSRFGQPTNTMPRELPKAMPTNFNQPPQQPTPAPTQPTFNNGRAGNQIPGITGPATQQPQNQQIPSYGSLNSKQGIANAWQNATNNGQNGSQAGSALTTMLVNSMTPEERQRFFATGQMPQPSTNPFAKRSLIA